MPVQLRKKHTTNRTSIINLPNSAITTKLPGFAANAPKSLRKLLKKDPSIAQYIKKKIDEMENGVLEV